MIAPRALHKVDWLQVHTDMLSAGRRFEFGNEMTCGLELEGHTSNRGHGARSRRVEQPAATRPTADPAGGRRHLRCLRRRDGRHESVPTVRQRLHERRVASVVAKGNSNLADAEVESLIEVDPGLAPHFAPELVSRDDVSGAADQNGQDSGRLALQRHKGTVPPQRTCPDIERESAKPNLLVQTGKGRD